MARPTMLTPARRKAIVNLVRAGHTLESTAAFTGISGTTIREWVRRGEGTDGTRAETPRFAAFASQIADAREHLEGQLLASAVTAAVGVRDEDGEWLVAPDWRAAVKLLEKLWPQKYGGRPTRSQAEMLAAAERINREHGTDVPPEAVVRRAMEIADAAEAGDLS